MTRVGRTIAATAAIVLLGTACTIGQRSVSEGPRATRSPGPPSPRSTASPAAASPATGDPLCPPSPKPTATPERAGTLPAPLAAVADQVEGVRELRFEHPVGAQPVTRTKMQQLLAASFDQNYPIARIRAQGRALIAIGALPPGTDLVQALRDFSSGQVIGYFDTQSKHLVFIGTPNPTPFQRFTLAHELTHALDDQHFDLSRSDRIPLCEGDRSAAYTSLAEGDATQTQYEWATRTLSGPELLQLQNEAAAFPAPPEVPEFVQEELEFPYTAGQRFVEALQARGGESAVDAAFRDPPVSTEQILHPDRYPSDAPQELTVPDLAAKLGTGWKAIDREETGEEDLRTLLRLRLSSGAADDAAAGWDGGEYLAWAKGSTQTAVMLETVWDSAADADQFAGAILQWGEGQPIKVEHQGTSVTVLFASDGTSLRAVEHVTG